MASQVPKTLAFEAGYYPEQSVLAEGNWVKISIDSDGLYRIPVSTLRSWGFNDLSKVRIYGTGGERMADPLTTDNYPADLPLIQSTQTDAGIVFYGRGPGSWTAASDGVKFFYFNTNIYASEAYYYVTDSEIVAREIEDADVGSVNPTDGVATTFMQRLHYEQELSSPGEAGGTLVGEDFRYTKQRYFDFNLPSKYVPGNKLHFRTSFVSKFANAGSKLQFTVNGAAVEELRSDRIDRAGTNTYIHGIETITTHDNVTSLTEATDKLRIGITLSAIAAPSIAALNYLTVNYERTIELPSTGYLCFSTDSLAVRLTTDIPDKVTIWDVTDPSDIRRVGATASGNSLEWSHANETDRDFVAWRADASIPAPTFVGKVANQNLHGLDTPDMVIFAPSAFKAQAQRLADFHATTPDSLKVYVVDIEDVYNEFSGGHADPAGIRNFLKMLYDRGKEGTGRELRYALMFARMTIDNRHLIRSFGTNPTIPGWTLRSVSSSLSDNDGYFTDDFCAMLEDGSGENMRKDKLSIAIGRIPVVDATEARNVVDKEIEYSAGVRHTAWKQRLMFLADDGNAGIHLTQSEKMISEFQNKESMPFIIRKVYMESYAHESGGFPDARTAMFRNLDEGIVWWNFIGHASPTGWTADNMLNYTDLNQLYLRHVPFIYAATCSFLRLDASAVSGAELLYKERYGGCIGCISATRPVYIADNGPLSAAVGRAMGVRDEKGRILTPGEMYRRGKNDLRNILGLPMSDDNRFRYVFVGDPALRLAVPDNLVTVDSIGGEAVDLDNPPTISALSRTTISGRVTTPSGELRSDFNGTVTIDIFDAERTLTTIPVSYEDDEQNFEDIGERVYTGSAKVRNGYYTLTAAMPAEFSQNYRPSTLGAFAYSSERNEEASGVFRSFYLYGYDEDAPADNTAPSISEMVLNHNTFRSGDIVNDSPMLIATISDDTGINVSTAGIGHQITATLDGTRVFNDLAFYYTPSTDGSPSGVLNYPFDALTSGHHTLSLRVWDTSGNSTTREIEFVVEPGLTPKIYDIYSDSNPAFDSANFYLSHDQPDGMVTVEVTVYNLLGRPVWTGKSSGRSDMFLSVPVSWDLTDGGGHRVPRGIYLYRARITADGTSYETATRRIAVAAG